MTDQELVQRLLIRARAAQHQFEEYNQPQVDEVVAGVAWTGYKQENADRLAWLACEYTKLGNHKDKVTKIRRKTLGTMRDLKARQTHHFKELLIILCLGSNNK